MPFTLSTLDSRTAERRGPGRHAARVVGRARAAAIAATAIAIGVALAPAGANAQVLLPDGFSHQVVVPGLSQPVAMAFLPDGRLLVAEQVSGRIRLVVNEALAGDAGVVPGINTAGGERGLLGLAVDPGWPARPFLYVHYTAVTGTAIRISRFTAAGDLVFAGDGQITFDPASRHDLIADAPDLRSIHNGGTVRFGPDGRLFASLGEDNNRCGAQDTVSLGGVILRLDVSRLPAGPGGPPARDLITPPDNPFATSTSANRRLIWAMGLRNPFRFHVDPIGGALYIADVGHARWEELSRADRGGRNFGWPFREGPEAFDEPCPQARSTFTEPIHAYGRGSNAAVISAGVYRAPAGAPQPFPLDYEGDVFVSDYYAGFLRRLTGAGAVWSQATPAPGQPAADRWGEGFAFVSDWAVGPDGALWFCRQTGGGGSAGSIERVIAAEGTPRPPAAGVSFGPPTPSPAAGPVRFDYAITVPLSVSLSIHDAGGRLVRRLVRNRTDAAGPHTETWDGADEDGRLVRSGVYVARLEAGGTQRMRRVVIVR